MSEVRCEEHLAQRSQTLTNTLTDEIGLTDGTSRHTALQTGAAGLGAVGLTGAATARDHDNDDGDDPDVDESDGFEVEVVEEHATVPTRWVRRSRSCSPRKRQ